MELDRERQADQRRRSDALREEARYLREQAGVLVRQAEQIERTWSIPPPCDYCRKRYPDEPHTPGCWMLK